jgi:uncharacterized delta-60 repeat protein
VSWPTSNQYLPDEIRRIVIDDQGRLVAVGTNYTHNGTNFIMRLNSSGSFDTSFNTSGYKNFNFQDLTQIDRNDFADIVISNNKYTIVGGGDSDRQQNSYVPFSGLARISLNGDFDTSLDTDGIMLPFSSQQTYFEDAELLSDGSILISGSVRDEDNIEMFLAKLLPPEVPPTTTTPPTTTPVTLPPPTTAPNTTVPAPVPAVTTENNDIKLVISVSRTAILKKLKLTVPKGGKVSMTTKTKKVCKVVKTKVIATSTGTCRVAITITAKKKKKISKTLSFRVS